MKEKIDVSEAEFRFRRGDKLEDEDGKKWTVEDVMFSAYSGEHFYYVCRVGGRGQATKTGSSLDGEMTRVQ